MQPSDNTERSADVKVLEMMSSAVNNANRVEPIKRHGKLDDVIYMVACLLFLLGMIITIKFEFIKIDTKTSEELVFLQSIFIVLCIINICIGFEDEDPPKNSKPIDAYLDGTKFCLTISNLVFLASLIIILFNFGTFADAIKRTLLYIFIGTITFIFTILHVLDIIQKLIKIRRAKKSEEINDVLERGNGSIIQDCMEEDSMIR